MCVGAAACRDRRGRARLRGSKPAYTSVLFALVQPDIVVIGALIAVRHPRSPSAGSSRGSDAFDLDGDFLAATGIGPRWTLARGPLAEWIGSWLVSRRR